MAKKHSSEMKRERVLHNHKRVGNRFIPPFLYKIGPLTEISWIDELLPELVWIGLIINRYGYHKGVDIALQLSKAAKSIHKTEICEFFAWLSTFNRLTAEEWISLEIMLSELGVLSNILQALNPLFALYPGCPLSPLAGGNISPTESALSDIKAVVQEMYPRRELLATRVQSTAIYFSLVADCLKVAPGISLANFPEVEKYPNTEESRAIASTIRATLNTFYGIERDHFPSQWPITFWNRGFELDKCERLSEYQEKHQEQNDG
jgi:hypothetical protein